MHKIYLIGLFSIVFIITLQAQSLKTTLALADKQYADAQYGDAIKTYQRVAFFDNKNSTAINLKIAACCFHIQQYQDAISYYDLALNNATSDSLQDDIYIKKALAYLALDEIEFALAQVASVKDTINIAIKKRKAFLNGYIYFKMEEYKLSENNFINYATKDSTKLKIQEIFIENNKINKLNPRLAKTLSAIIPGIGQLYAGDIKNGINSFLLNASMATLVGIIAYRYTVFDSFIAVFPWFWRYYRGGQFKAEKITFASIEKKRNELLTKIILAVEQDN